MTYMYNMTKIKPPMKCGCIVFYQNELNSVSNCTRTTENSRCDQNNIL